MTTYLNGTPVKPTPKGHTVHPDCVASAHGYVNAHRYRGCTCPGPTYTAFLARRARNNEKRKADKAAAKAEKQAVMARMTPVGRGALRRLSADEAGKLNRRAAYREAGDAERELRQRDDLACQSEDPELFFVNGFGGAADAQIRAARAVCATCPLDARRLCLTAGLDRADDFALLAGTTPQERRKMRQARSEVAA